MTVIVVSVVDKLHNMTERCGGVVCLASDNVEANKRIEATPSDMVFSLRLSLTRLRSFDVMRNLDQPLATGIFGANKKEPDRCIKHPYQPRILLYFQTINLLLSTFPPRRVLQAYCKRPMPRPNLGLIKKISRAIYLSVPLRPQSGEHTPIDKLQNSEVSSLSLG